MSHKVTKERFIFTVIFSIVLHLIVVLGVSFNSSPQPPKPLSNLDVTIVTQKSNKPNKSPDYLAQANNQGGGDAKKPSKMVEKKANKTIHLQQGGVMQAQLKDKLETSRQYNNKSTEPSTKQHNKQEISAQNKSDKASNKQLVKRKPEQQESALVFMDKINMQLNQILAEKDKMYKGTDTRIISPSTQQSDAAAYLKAWQSKVERIGNLNYPEAAREQGITGRLLLAVDIRPDGSVPFDGIRVIQSSGYQVLDEAAMKIVKLGAPYAVVPKAVLQGKARITITRAWYFGIDNQLLTK